MERNSPQSDVGPDASNWYIRRLNEADIPVVAVLFDAADRADNLYKLASDESIKESFGGLGAESHTQAIVAFDAKGGDEPPVGTVPLGVGRISHTLRKPTAERVYSVMLRVHPLSRQGGLQHVIARRLIDIARATESGPATENAKSVRVRTYVFDSQESSIEAWEKVGLRRVRTGWTMERKLEEPLKIEQVPDAFRLRPYSYPGDNSQALEVLNGAFADYYDHAPLSEATWAREMAAPYSRPDLSWLAFSSGDDKSVGLAACQVSDSENRQTGRLEGWIEGIGVLPEFRRIGLGKALLSYALRSLQTSGLKIALADVDAESPAAVGLFRSSGFRVRTSLLQYECLLDQIEI